jgi:hypothetical protein
MQQKLETLYQPVGESAENLRFMEMIHCPAGDL